MIAINTPDTSHLLEGITTAPIAAYARDDQRVTIPAGTPVTLDLNEDPGMARVSTTEGAVAYLNLGEAADTITAA